MKASVVSCPFHLAGIAASQSSFQAGLGCFRSSCSHTNLTYVCTDRKLFKFTLLFKGAFQRSAKGNMNVCLC